MNRIFAFLWLFLIGTNILEFYASLEEKPYQGIVILLGAMYFAAMFHKSLFALMLMKDFLLALLLVSFEFLFLLVSPESFSRGIYTSAFAIPLVFLVGSLIGAQRELGGVASRAFYLIATAGSILNLYELFVDNNHWSTAPGRSAGFYINPNISAKALLGYGLFFLVFRFRKFTLYDFLLCCCVVAGVFATFSRGGILTLIMLLPAVVLWRLQKDRVRILLATVVLCFLAAGFITYVLKNLQLTQDSMSRIESLVETGGVGDFQETRGELAVESVEMARQHFWTGNGVRAIYELEQGPHNMYLAMLVDYGIAGLLLYLLFLWRLLLIAWRAREQRELSDLVFVYLAWLFIFSFSSHNLLGNAATILLMGFLIGRAYLIQSEKRLVRLGT